MANTLGVYNPIFYAQEALINLEKSLGMANRVYRGFEEERRAFRKGDTINIRRPSTFTANSAPSSAQDVTTETVSMTLDSWQEVKFALTDKELAYTQDRIIEDHIRPAAYALAAKIDTDLCALYSDIPHKTAVGGTPAISDITGARKAMFNNEVPMEPGRLHMMVDGTLEDGFLQLSAFSQDQGAGSVGVNTQMTGSLGQKFGYEIFANQNVAAQAAASSALTVTAGKVNSASVAVGDTSIPLDGGTLTGTFDVGDTITITTSGVDYDYAVTASVTASTNAATVSISPPARVAHADNDVFTASQTGAKQENLAFHRNAFALCMVELPDMANELGARVVSVSDPRTGLAVRSRIYYDGDNSKVNVALDCLYGVKTLDPDMAVRMEQ